jgi:hypothetical protein
MFTIDDALLAIVMRSHGGAVQRRAAAAGRLDTQ